MHPQNRRGHKIASSCVQDGSATVGRDLVRCGYAACANSHDRWASGAVAPGCQTPSPPGSTNSCSQSRSATLLRFVPGLAKALESVLKDSLSAPDHMTSARCVLRADSSWVPPWSLSNSKLLTPFKEPLQDGVCCSRLCQECSLGLLALRGLTSIVGQPRLYTNSLHCWPSLMHAALACASQVYHLSAHSHVHGSSGSGCQASQQLALLGASTCHLVCALLRQRDAALHAVWPVIAPICRQLLELAHQLHHCGHDKSEAFGRRAVTASPILQLFHAVKRPAMSS
jgi:hypothetical protein